jgi:hypothetical protein
MAPGSSFLPIATLSQHHQPFRQEPSVVRSFKLALVAAAALCCGAAFAAPTNVIQTDFGIITLPISQGFSNTFTTNGGSGYVDASGDAIDGSTITAPFSQSAPLVTGVFNFYDDFVFTLPESTGGSLTASAVSVSFQNLIGINNLQVRLYPVVAGSLTTGVPASLVSGWSTPLNAGGSTLTVSTFANPIAVTAGKTYTLEIRGDVFGPTGSYGGNLNITATPAVPEAEGWALALMGLGLVGAAARRTRKQA